MRYQAEYRLIHNRKHRDGEQLVQVKILLPSGKYKYVSTGVKVTDAQWDDNALQVVNHRFAARLNKLIAEVVDKIRTHEMRLNLEGIALDAAAIVAAVGGRHPAAISFVDFVTGELMEQTKPGAQRYLHLRVVKNLKAAGVERFTDLTYSGIERFDRHIKSFLGAQASIYKQHAVVGKYITIAQKRKLFSGPSPYLDFKVPKGKHRIRVRLDDTEIDLLERADMPDGALSIARDCYLFQVYTGLSYKDLCALSPASFRTNNDGRWIEGLRKKTGEFYTVYLIDQAVSILERYGYRIPAPASYTQNRLLKVVAATAGINKNLTTHTARHSAASWMLRKGIPLAVIQQILGHSQIETTAIYARLERQTIKDEMSRLSSSSR